jgi:UDP-N-acetylglucosamine acyltransferase
MPEILSEAACSPGAGIAPQSVVHPGARIGQNVTVGPFTVIEEHVEIGDNTTIASGVVIKPYTKIGRCCEIHSGAVLGGPPQDTKFCGEVSYLVLGDHNIVREYVTIHRATGPECATIIGDHNMIMAYSHVGHNCEIGNNVMMANQVGISGHVVIEDRVVIGGMVGIHQYVRIGKLAMIGGFSKVVQDVPPFMMADGRPSRVYGLNVRGLRRAGISTGIRSELKQAFRLLYANGLNMSQAIESVESEVRESGERDYLLEFLRSEKLGFGGRQLERGRAGG